MEGNKKQGQSNNDIEGEDLYLEKDSATKRYNLKEVFLPKGNIERVVVNCKNWGDISDKEFEYICGELEESNAKSIQLSMRNNSQITEEGMQYLQQAISLNQSCIEIVLDFDKCDKITNKSLQQISQGLSINEYIQRIQINFRYSSHLTNEGIYYLSQFLKRKNNKLTHINLNFEYCFNLTDESVVYISESLKGSNSVQELALNFNSCHISDVGLLTLSDTVISCKNLKQLVMKLELCDQITDVGLATLAQCLSQKSSLIAFSLFLSSNQEITNKGIKRLFEQFNSLQTNLKQMVLQVESIPKINGKLLKYIQNVMSVNDRKLELFILRVRQCTGFNQLAFEQLQDLLKSKQTAIQEIILDFTNQNFFSTASDSSESYRKILDQGIASQSKIQILFGNMKAFNYSDTQHIQSSLKSMNLSKKIAISYNESEKLPLLSESFIFQNNSYRVTSDQLAPPFRDQSYYLQFSENKEKNELQVSKLKWNHPTNQPNQREPQTIKVKLNLEKCSSLNVLRDVDICLKNSNLNQTKLDIKITQNQENQEFFEATKGMSENCIQQQENGQKQSNEELDQTNLASFIYSLIHAQIYASLNLDVQFGQINDKIFQSISKAMKQNRTIRDWSFSFGECNQLTDEGLRDLFEDLNHLTMPLNALKINLEECTNISDKSIDKINSFITNNSAASSIELVFKKSNLISDKSLQDLLKTIENDQVDKRQFQIRFISCPKLSLKQMVLLDKAIKRKNGEIL